MSQIVVDQLKSEFLIFYWICPLHLHSSGIELMNAAALLLLFLLNLQLVGRQERLKRSEMVRRLKGIITQLSGKSGLLTDPWKHYGIMAYSSSRRSSLFICYTFSGLLFITFFFFTSTVQWNLVQHACWSVVCPNPHPGPGFRGHPCADKMPYLSTNMWYQNTIHYQYSVGPFIVVNSSWKPALGRGCWTEFELAHFVKRLTV